MRIKKNKVCIYWKWPSYFRTKKRRRRRPSWMKQIINNSKMTTMTVLVNFLPNAHGTPDHNLTIIVSHILSSPPLHVHRCRRVVKRNWIQSSVFFLHFFLRYTFLSFFCRLKSVSAFLSCPLFSVVSFRGHQKRSNQTAAFLPPPFSSSSFSRRLLFYYYFIKYFIRFQMEFHSSSSSSSSSCVLDS